MKAIIFGINGQDGYYLKQLCTKNAIEVIGISRSSGDWIQGDVADFSFVESIVKKESPGIIFHVAANSTTRHSALFENHAAIATGTLNILEAAKRNCEGCKVFITGSGVQFVNNGTAIKESDAFHASSPYSIARIQSVYAARYYRSLGMQTYVGYLFHHESPMRKPHHVSKMIADAAKRIAAGNNERLLIGNISVGKEWAFAGDIANGIFTLINQDNVFEATIGTGKVYTIKEWLTACFEALGLQWEDHVDVRQDYQPEYSILFSDTSTINKLGWSAKTSFEELVYLILKN